MRGILNVNKPAPAQKMAQKKLGLKEHSKSSWYSDASQTHSPTDDVYDEAFSGSRDDYERLYHGDCLEVSEDGTVNLVGQQLKTLRPDPNDPRLLQIKNALLDFNAFQDVPPCVLGMTNLQTLSAFGQVNRGQASKDKKPALRCLPEHIGQLIHLQTLNAGNNVINVLPDSMSKLHNLKELDLRLNHLQCFPAVICTLENLKTLILSGNRLSGLPREIKQLRQLEGLHLGNNSVETVPDEICQLQQLHTLVLRNNKIQRLPKHMFRLQGLLTTQKSLPTSGSVDKEGSNDDDDDDDRGLILEGNPLTWPPQNVWSKGTADVYAFLENKCKEPIPALFNKGLRDLTDVVEKHPNVEILDVRQNKLTSLPQNLNTLRNLEKLYLDKNRLTEFQVQILSELSELRVLSMCEQKNGSGLASLSQLPEAIHLCKSIQELYLASNVLTTIPNGLVCLKALRVLDLQSNKLSEIPIQLSYLRNLECLLLRDNCLVEIPEEIGQLEKLKVLTLSKNELTCIPDSIGCLTELMTLSLRKNKLRFLPESITQLTNLTTKGECVTLHTTYRNELKVEQNDDMKIPPKHICMQGAGGIFKYFRDMKKDDPIYLDAEIEKLMVQCVPKRKKPIGTRINS